MENLDLNTIYERLGALLATTNAMHEKIDTKSQEQKETIIGVNRELKDLTALISTLEKSTSEQKHLVNQRLDILERKLKEIESPLKYYGVLRSRINALKWVAGTLITGLWVMWFFLHHYSMVFKTR